MVSEKIAKADRQTLLTIPAFRRWFFTVLQTSGMFEASATVADGRHLYLEGRRSLALDLLRSLDTAQPEQSPSGLPVSTLIQLLAEQAQSPAIKETPVATRNVLYSELDESDAA